MPKSAPHTVRLSLGPLTIADVLAVVRRAAKVTLTPAARRAMLASRRAVEHSLTDGDPHYGINTGFGSLSKQRIGPTDLATLQVNLVRSHAAGVGETLPVEIVRATMLLLAASLARGHSGVRPELAELIIEMLNRGVTPVVPSVGSVGASGDLAPLAAIALVLIGEGEAFHNAKRTTGAKALAGAGLKPVALAAKEGLALINGTHLMAARGALLSADAATLIDAATVATAMSIDACRATDAFLDERLYDARNHLGPRVIAARLRSLLKHSEIITSHLENDPRVQDPYSLRAAPTVLGAVLRAVGVLTSDIEAELGAVTDNPLVFIGTKKNADIISGANFHGMPLALPLDYLAMALAHVAGIAERRVYLMTGAFEPESHLKPFLAPRPGLQSGLMIAQYTAAAACNELIGLATPASPANISTSAGMEDYNSFGPRAAAKAERALALARYVVAIEFLCAAQAIEYHRPLTSGRGIERAHAIIREHVPALGEDRSPTADIEAISNLIAAGAFAECR
ncbi:MAG: histidine ammonia-lyase [Tepidisphaera sp.]|nr:histidine ammonia-lyase [Tepidisphaera sp.]